MTFIESNMSYRHRLDADLSDLHELLHATDFSDVSSMKQLRNRIDKLRGDINSLIDSAEAKELLLKGVANELKEVWPEDKVTEDVKVLYGDK